MAKNSDFVNEKKLTKKSAKSGVFYLFKVPKSCEKTLLTDNTFPERHFLF